MARTPLPAVQRLVWPLEAWPEPDRRLWLAGLEPGDGFDGPDYAAGLAPTTLQGARKSYGCWLAVLDEAGELDPLENPAARVTRRRARLYLRVLQGRNAANTIHARFWQLQSALRVMHPEADFAWLTVWLHRLLPISLRERVAPDSRELLAWGEGLTRDALLHPRAPVRRTLYRNGLLIAVLACFGMRLRSVAALRIGRQLLRGSDGSWRIELAAGDVKNRKAMPYELSDRLAAHLERYLEIERAELLEGQEHDWLWVGRGGAALDMRRIEGVIRRGSKLRFGHTFGPHTFRHALATTAAQANPDNPGLAVALLGVSEAVVQGHYNRASQVDALTRLHACLEAEREALPPS